MIVEGALNVRRFGFTPSRWLAKIRRVRATRRILLVESDVEERETLRGTLADQGYDVRSIEPGESIDDFEPDLLVLDLRDPAIDTDLADGLRRAALASLVEPLASPNIIQVADVYIDVNARVVRRAGHVIDLTATEFSLLVLLARNADRVVSREQLLHELWSGTAVTANLIEVYVSSLRRKLEHFGPRIVYTVRGFGYRM